MAGRNEAKVHIVGSADCPESDACKKQPTRHSWGPTAFLLTVPGLRAPQELEEQLVERARKGFKAFFSGVVALGILKAG